MGREDIFSAALDALNKVVNIGSEDRILIMNDISCQSIADAFNRAALSKGCEIDSFLINEDERPLTEIPEPLIKLLKDKTVVLNILKAFPEEINFRIKWLFKLEENKDIKCAHMPGITEAMMTEGPMNVDYASMQKNASSLINSLSNADYLHITTKAGTDLMLGIRNRIFTDDVTITKGKISNLPCGEVYCAPEETKADGVIVFDASIGDIGLLKFPLKVNINEGRIERFESEDKKLVERIKELSSIDDEAKIIGELGIGINPGARITGNMLEDEKAIHTAHIAFGNNEDFPGGGKNHSKIHRDYLFYSPTIEILFNNKPNRKLMKEGEFLL
ncbi:MAG: aminopeptidase [Ignavibacteriaceae bacterium]|jgi:aminopeptidase